MEGRLNFTKLKTAPRYPMSIVYFLVQHILNRYTDSRLKLGESQNCAMRIKYAKD
jgi:hypothetical protein